MSKWYPTWSKIAPKTTPRNTTQHDTTQDYPTQPNTTQHNTTQHDTTRHETTQNNKRHDTTQEKVKDVRSKKYCNPWVEMRISRGRVSSKCGATRWDAVHCTAMCCSFALQTGHEARRDARLFQSFFVRTALPRDHFFATFCTQFV